MNYEASSDYLDAIAVIGMAGQFPGAKNIDSFWENLRNGIESIFTLNNDDLISVGIAPEVFQDTNYIKAKGILENIELFDANFFGFNPKEAEITDPQHRIFLECAWEALENAGYNSEIYPGKIGVYAGLSQSTYLLNNLITNRELIDSVGTYQIWLGNDRDFLATLVSYKLNLTGPSVVVQTACSTSLVAIHYACQSLIAGESDIALAGGVSIAVPHRVGYTYQKGGIFAFDGHCRAFDAEASGTVGGNGAGIVVLKRLEDALADRDCIHAVIRGSAINNDGAVKVGYTAPSIEGQAKAIAETHAVAGVEPESITYIETHGTGTVLGDPIEMAALNKVFRASTQKTGFCAIGSVKTNIGHLDTAAGIAGFIKTVLALKHQQIPPSLHFQQPNPQIDFANSPFYVNTTLSPWQTNDTPRRAGVSSFGIGGTNAHVVLEETPSLREQGEQGKQGKQGERGRDYLLLCLSAKTAIALEQTTANLIRHLQQHPDVNLADVAYTLGIGRHGFNYRRVLVCKDVSDAVTTLENPDSPQVLTCYQERRNPPVAFMFPGQGTQYVKMGWEVYQTEPIFKEAVDICSEILKPHLGLDLRCVLYPSQEETELASQQLNQTAIAQPAIFTIEYALSQLLMSWGILPQVMIGHSIGEYIAAHLAGVFSLEEVLALVAARGQLMQQMPPGSMLAVSLAAEEVQPLLSKECAIAAINAPSLCVVSGTIEAIAQLEHQLIENSIKSRRLHTSHAFHSPMMEPILEAFGEQVKKVNFQPPKIPYISNVTGTWITTAQATDPNYWVQHLCSSVQFAKGVQLLLQESDRLLLEVGAGNTLSTFAKLSSVGSQAVLTTLPHAQNRQSDSQYLLTTIGQLWMAGIDVDWTRFYQYEQRYRVPLPTYPFERQRYWIEPQKSAKIVESKPIVLNKKPDIADWFYMPCWKQSAISQSFDKITLVEQNLCWLVFVDESSFGSRLVQRLKKENQYVITVSVGKEFKKSSQNSYTINPQNSDDYHALFKELDTLNKIPHKILHLWSVTKNDRAASEIEFFEKTQDLGFYSLLFLAQALGKQHLANSVEIGVISSDMQPVTGEEILCPEKATVLGLCLVIPQEYPHITCQSIDIAMPLSQSWQEEKLIDSVLSELVTKSADSVIAYRASRRWVQTFEPVQLEAPVEKEALVQGAGGKGENSIQCLFVQDQHGLREQGVYLITGGLGNIGFVLAEYLAKTVQARLILIGRSPLAGVSPSLFPARVAWQQWLDTHDPQDKISQQILKVQTLEAHGAKVIVKSADVANLEQMQSAIAQACENFGEINGVIHAAGLLGNEYFKTIQQITKAECEQQFHAKVHGLFVLQKILQGKPLDFCLLTSSLSSVLGGLGFVAYSAANLFMDAFTHQCNQFNVFPWLSVNWDGWKIPAAKQVNIKLGATLAEFVIAPNEGIEVLKCVLSNTYPQVVVSTGDLKARIDQWIKQKPFKNTESVNKVATVSLHSRPDLKSAYIAPQNEIEQIITNIWQELLGIHSIGIHDDFFELGGHSLLATQVIAQMNKALQVEFSLSSLFELPTVKALSDDLAGYERWASPRWKRSQNTEKNTILPLAAMSNDKRLGVYAPNPEQRYQPFPLTDVQQAYWIGRSGTFELGNVATHGYIELESHGLNLERLKLAVQRLIEHHDMLRAIVLSDGQQQILKQAPTYQIEILDLRGQNSEVIASQLQAVRQQMSHQILAADRWPLFEIRASRLDNDCIRLHLSFDYLIVDAWSLGEILAPQLHQLYQNLETVLVPLEISFRDYVLAEIALRDSEIYRNSRDYWFNRLSKLPPAPELPLAKNPSSITKPHFINRNARLQPATWLRLKTRATQAGLTPSGVLLAAYAEVLSVWSKTPKFTLNLTLFNRLPLHPQVNNIVGDFTSLTLLAVDCSTSESFLSRARSLQKQLWQDLEHRHISGVEVLRELARTQGGATRAAMPVVFTSTLTQNTAPQGTSDWEKLGKVVYSISQTPQVWLDHQVSENEGALLWSWDAVEELFPEGFLDDMFAAYCRLLDSLATDESVWQSTKLQLLPPAQLKQLAAINATESPVSQAMLHTLFAGQVPRRQHQPAVITPNRTLTYEELACLAHQVAYRLRQLGVLPNTLVAVVMEKGWQQIVAVLGILQSGAAYLPIDPELPTERRWHIFQQAEVQVVLTQSWLDNTLSWPDSIQRICVDNLAAVDDILPLEPGQTPTDLAYVIYTSGSTGIPKGVMIDHRGAVNTILDINQRFGIGANDRVLALSSLSFDLSVYDIFGTLAAGGTIVIPEATNTKEPAHWLKLIRQHQVTVWNSVPALMQMLVEYAVGQSDELPNSLRLVLLSGDRIPLNLPTQIKSLWENIQIVSLGGATEASIWSILYPIAKTDSTWNTIPYGRPLTNQRFYVFNQALTECPVWVPGQLYIGGVGLAQGYWRDQKKTNASFMIHPQTKERLYKTGDLGRYLPDGNIEFLGREDFQVKINGYRIELGEIEATLRKYPTVKEVVVAVGESPENQQLVAYIVPQSDLADSNQQQAEAYEPRQLPGVLLDPVERIEFKLKQKGLRQLKPSQSSIQLPKPKFDEILTQEYLQRQSYRQFQDEPISLEMFSQFLSCMLQMQLEDSPLPKYRYPSAGSLYPVQTYLSVKPNRIAGLGAGYYYYHPADHNLILLNAETSIWGNIYSGNQPIFEQSAFSLFLIGQLSAIAPMYGDLARDFCLLEAGYIGQLLMNSAPENQIGLCPIGYLEFEKHQGLLSLEPDQILLHSFLGGKIDQAQTRQWLQPPISRKPDSLTEDIHNFLQQKLPEYLLPSTYVFLDSLPLTPNGKVDRKALPVPEIVRKNLKEGFVAPRNHTEKTLVAIFGEILGGKEIGIHDNFFELGGDSLRATQVMTRLREAFQVDLPLRRLFDNPTVATLGDRIEALRITQVTPDITVSDREQGRL